MVESSMVTESSIFKPWWSEWQAQVMNSNGQILVLITWLSEMWPGVWHLNLGQLFRCMNSGRNKDKMFGIQINPYVGY